MTDAPTTLPLDGQLCFSIYSTSLAIQRVYKPMLDALGVTYTQYLVLSALWETDGLTIGAIAERLALEPSTITPAVKRLEAAGFLARRRSTVDERLVEVHLTEKGAGLHPKTACLTDALLRHSGFDVPGMIELNRLVQTLRQGMRDAPVARRNPAAGRERSCRWITDECPLSGMHLRSANGASGPLACFPLLTTQTGPWSGQAVVCV